MVDVHDQVVDLQIAEVREERSSCRAAPLVDLFFFLETSVSAPIQPGVGRSETARES
jgi:hypothetical protein